MITRNPLFTTLRSICVFIEFSGIIGMFQRLIRAKSSSFVLHPLFDNEDECSWNKNPSW